MKWLLVALGCFLALPAQAQIGQPLNCSGTVGTGAAAVVFAQVPTLYVLLVNPSASATLWIDAKGGTAAANASGSVPLVGTGNSLMLQPPTPTISIIASVGSTPYTCWYR